MDLSKLLEMQKVLDERIVKEKGLEGQDLVPNTFVALLTELGEFANEGRWFKHWKVNPQPNTKEAIECSSCNGTGDENAEANLESLMKERGSVPYQVCTTCNETGVVGYRNPLLEEFVDGVHFFLSIAIQKGWEESLYIHQEAIMDLERDGLDGGLTGIYLELMFFLNMSHQGANKKIYGKPSDEYYFSMAWFLFIGMGMVGFGFEEKQIKQAYISKNRTNHERQDNSY